MSLTKRIILLSIASMMVMSALASMGCSGKKASKRGIMAKNDAGATPDGGTTPDGGSEKLVVDAEQAATEEKINTIREAFKMIEDDSKAIAMSDLKKGTFTLIGISAIYTHNGDNETLSALNTSIFKNEKNAETGKYENNRFEDAGGDSKAIAGTMSNGSDEGELIDMPAKFLVQEDGKWAASRASEDALNITVRTQFAGSEKGVVADFIGGTEEGKVPKVSILDILAKGTPDSSGKITLEDGSKVITLTLVRDVNRDHAIRALITVDVKNEEGTIETSRQISVEYQDLDKAATDQTNADETQADDTAKPAEGTDNAGAPTIPADEFQKSN